MKELARGFAHDVLSGKKLKVPDVAGMRTFSFGSSLIPIVNVLVTQLRLIDLIITETALRLRVLS